MKTASGSVGSVKLGNGYQTLFLKALMDDITIISTSENDTGVILERLAEGVTAARMKFKPKKSISLSLRKGRKD